MTRVDETHRISFKLVEELPDVTEKIYILPVKTKDRRGKEKVVYEEWMFQKHKIGYFTGLKPEEEKLFVEAVELRNGRDTE